MSNLNNQMNRRPILAAGLAGLVGLAVGAAVVATMGPPWAEVPVSWRSVGVVGHAKVGGGAPENGVVTARCPAGYEVYRYHLTAWPYPLGVGTEHAVDVTQDTVSCSVDRPDADPDDHPLCGIELHCQPT